MRLMLIGFCVLPMLLLLNGPLAAQQNFGDAVKSAHYINLKLTRSGGKDVNLFISKAVDAGFGATNAYYPKLGNSAERLLIKSGGRDGSELKNGDTVTIYYNGSDYNSWSSGWKPYNTLYVSEGFTEAAFWEYKSSHSNWKIWVKGIDQRRKDPVKYGNTIYLESVHYPNRYLCQEGDKWLDANSASETQARGEWVILGHGKPDTPPELKLLGDAASVVEPKTGVAFVDNLGGEANPGAEVEITVSVGVEVGFSQETTKQWDVGSEVGFQAGTDANFVTGSVSFGYGEAETNARSEVQSKNISKTLKFTYNKPTDAEVLIRYRYGVPWKLNDVDCGGVKSCMRVLDGSVKFISSQDITIPSRDRDGNIKPRAWNEIEQLLNDYRKVDSADADRIVRERKPVWLRNGWVYEGDVPPPNVPADVPADDPGNGAGGEGEDGRGRLASLALQGKVLTRRIPRVGWLVLGGIGILGFVTGKVGTSFRWKLLALLTLLLTLAPVFLAFVPLSTLTQILERIGA